MIAVSVMDWTGHTIRSVGLQQDELIVQTGLRKTVVQKGFNIFRTNLGRQKKSK